MQSKIKHRIWIADRFLNWWHGLNMTGPIKVAFIGFIATIAAAFIIGIFSIINTIINHNLSQVKPKAGSNITVVTDTGFVQQQSTEGDQNITTQTTGPNSPIAIDKRTYYAEQNQTKETKTIHDVAYAIYAEVLGIVKKIEIYISKIDNGEKISFENIKLNQQTIQDFEKRSLLPESELKNSLTNFCNTINSIDILFQKQDLQRCVDQGRVVLSQFSKNYGFKDYDTENQATSMIAVSPDSSIISSPDGIAGGTAVTFTNKDDNS
ncbi:MAG: hypothetical protein ISS45_06615 [Candidatus Omnitrophica bacterium]|nr:hypothetical protein [Candidatus Omnitrophota bacterium]